MATAAATSNTDDTFSRLPTAGQQSKRSWARRPTRGASSRLMWDETTSLTERNSGQTRGQSTPQLATMLNGATSADRARRNCVVAVVSPRHTRVQAGYSPAERRRAWLRAMPAGVNTKNSDDAKTHSSSGDQVVLTRTWDTDAFQTRNASLVPGLPTCTRRRSANQKPPIEPAAGTRAARNANIPFGG